MKPGVFDDPDHYAGLTLAQPYGGATFLSAQGFDAKDVESRKARITRVGAQIVLCIGQARWAPDMARLHRDLVNSGRVPAQAFDSAMGLSGVAVALAKVAGCRPLREEDYHRCLWWDAAENTKKPRWAWELDWMRPLRPFPWKGCQGWSRVPRKMVKLALV